MPLEMFLGKSNWPTPNSVRQVEAMRLFAHPTTVEFAWFAF